MKLKNRIFLLSGPVLFIFFLISNPFLNIPVSAYYMIGVIFWMAIWWTTEAVPIAITSLLPIILFPILGIVEISETTESYGHKYVFLYMGGFIIAVAIEKWNLHKRIALNIINIIGTNFSKIILGFMVATAFLSMFISNTATTVMMLPIAISVVKQFEMSEKKTKELGKVIMLSIAYAASIGGVATLIGTPTNLILAGFISESFDVQITFSQWMKFGFPISIFLLIICWIYLTQYAFKFTLTEFLNGKKEIQKQLLQLGAMGQEEKLVLITFSMTGFFWITRSFLLKNIIPNIDDTIIAVFGALILFVLYSVKNDRPLLEWKEAVEIPWGILLLFGGGLALAQGFTTSGLAEWIGGQMTLLEGASLFILLLFLITLVNFLTEITSNLATTAMILPILAPLSLVIDVHPFMLMVGATVAASCAFMLPVATPPNAVVFGSGYLRIPDMVKSGIWMNLFSIFFLTLMVYFLLPLIWGIDPHNITDFIN